MHDVDNKQTSTVIPVRSLEGEYPTLLGGGLLARTGELAQRAGLGRKVVVASDSTVAPLYGMTLRDVLGASGFDTSLATMPAGEAHKNERSVGALVDAFLDARLDRSGWVLALGGGVVGDTVGYAASIYMRGVPLVQAPTTLLAMADSSVGGKVGVDHPRGKNLLGTFKQPQMVIADLDTLRTLPPEQIACGMAEIIKAGIIDDPELFTLIEQHSTDTLDYERVLGAAILVKKRIVESDPYERGERVLLNLGHTFGHAIEMCTGYSRLHGFAVAQGIVLAFRLAARLGMCDAAEGERVAALLARWGLPVRWGPLGLEDAGAVERVRAAMYTDKKRVDGKLRLILPERIGKVRIVGDVSDTAIMAVLAELQ